MTSGGAVPAAHELIEQMVVEGAKVEQTLRRCTTSCSSSGSSSSGTWQTSDTLRSIVECHPRYPQLVSLFYVCKKFSAEMDVVKALETEEAAYLLRLQEMRSTNPSHCPNELRGIVDNFMEAKLKRLEAIKVQLEASFQSVSKAAEALDAKISKLVLTKSWDPRLQDIPQTRNGAGTSTGGSGASSSSRHRGGSWDATDAALGDADASPEEMKRRAASENMKKALLKRKKKGKLPEQATEALKIWFDNNLHNPYPSEEQKQDLLDATGLDVKQVNNWFINQRKRHWEGKASTPQSSKRPIKAARTSDFMN